MNAMRQLQLSFCRIMLGMVFVGLPAARGQEAKPVIVRSGLIVDLDADKSVELAEGQVIAWKNQVDWKAKEFKATRLTGRPSLKKDVKAIRGHNSMVFDKKELLNEDEDAFDHLITGSGYTWFAVLAVHQQVTMEKDVNAFFGNLRNGQKYEGFWGGVTDDNVVWAGSRNSTTFGRWNNDNPQLLGPKLEQNRFYVIAGRMGAGKDQVTIDLFVNGPRPVASKPFPVNPKANSSKMAIGQERDATNHPGRESFKGEIARILFWERPLTDAELAGTLARLKEDYAIQAAPAAETKWRVYDAWPFDAAEAARRQAETARALGMADPLKLPLADAKGPALTFRLIPAGKFNMGSPATESGHEPDEALHPEAVAEPFYMMESQLTVEAYRALLRADPPGMAADADPKLPAAVSYRDAVDKVLPAIAKLAPRGWKVILPDRVRLEYAARAGTAGMNPGGNQEKDADAYAWFQGNSGNKVHPVRQKKPNAWGLFDVLGNRWHWYWAGPGANGDASKENHLIYGGAFNTPAAGNGARLANIMVSRGLEGVRFALIGAKAPLPKNHPNTGPGKDDK